ncbi:hypothetical protein C8Q77DRAFT_1061266, partial [Trametes polyzona]
MSRKELFDHCSQLVPDKDTAIAALREDTLVPASGEPSVEGLITGLLHLALLAKSKEYAVKGIIAFAHYAKEAFEAQLSTTVVDSVLTALQNQRIETGGTSLGIADDIKELRGVVEEVARKVEDVKDACRRVPDGYAGEAGGTPAAQVSPLSYAAVARMAGGQVPNPPATYAVDRARMRARQVLVDGVPLLDAAGERIAERVLVAKAGAAIDALKEGGEIVPPGLRVVAATALRNGGVIFEFSSAEAAGWVRASEDRARAFAVAMGADARVKMAQYRVVA